MRIAFGFIFIASLIVASLLKISFIDSKELWLDETYSAFIAGKSLPEIMEYVKGDVHPPLYYLFLKLWTGLFGHSPLYLKLFSVCISIIASLVFFVVVRKVIANKWLSLFCFVLFQMSPVLFWYSVEVRMYMLATLFVVSSQYYYLRMLDQGDMRDTLLFSFFAACAFYTHYVTSLLLPGLFLYVAFKNYSDQVRMRSLVISATVFFLITAPWYPILYIQKMTWTKVNTSLIESSLSPSSINYGLSFQYQSFVSFLNDLIENLASILGVYPVKNAFLLIALSLPFIIIIIYLTLSAFKNNGISRLLLTVISIYVSELIVLHWSMRRILIFLVPSIILMTGTAIEHMQATEKKYRYLSSIVIVFLLGIYMAGTLRIYRNDYCKPTTSIVKYIKENHQKNDLVLFHRAYFQVPFEYYASLVDFFPSSTGFPLSIHEWWIKQSFKGWGGPTVTKKELDEFTERLLADRSIKRIWLVLFETNNYDPQNILLSKLKYAALTIDERELYPGSCSEENNIKKRYRVIGITLKS